VGGKELQIPRLPPDFLSGLVVSVDLMRLYLKESRIRGRLREHPSRKSGVRSG
jgi:hypothetical protein